MNVFDYIATVMERPFIVHCTACKDRTGLTIALLHSVLDVERSIVLEDYGASEQILGRRFEDHVRSLYRNLALPVEILGENPRLAPPAFLEQTLAYMETREGTISQFLERH